MSDDVHIFYLKQDPPPHIDIALCLAPPLDKTTNRHSSSDMTKREREEDTSDNASKRFKSDCAETITIVVRGREMIVHKDLICAHSGFMRAASSGKWTGSTDGRLALTLDDGCTANHVKAYATWLYSRPGDLRDVADACRVESRGDVDDNHPNWRRYRLTESLVTL
ncbi:BTB/POZ domain-containing protein 8 [Teratosphaeria destructans]|uniref:BTB/POZ domain-containing protein 8 n=1 Tax=Teratosphaeria destructans TaxID=418781 RepID=A0A9W7SQ76_9PEZI|nr:BTB/POZ domain-containing protein 8 [Teratosphaeria destructans]